MCYSHATIFYGLFVRSRDLCAASDAWPRLKPAFLGIDLILLRRSKGTLETEEGGARLSEVPGEVWAIVKRELIDVELAQAAQEMAAVTLCPECEAQGREPKDLDALLKCPDCCEYFLHLGPMKAIHDLMSSQGLYYPCSKPFIREMYYLDADALSAVALPPPSSQQSLPSVSPTPRVTHSGFDVHQVKPFDPSIFASLPVAADSRILTFLKLFRLEVGDPALHVGEAQETTAKTNMAETEPRWQFWGFLAIC
ncbi:hypothetical protein JCM6882_000388 [Rhodosporidiobolus microsporus]